MEASFGHPQPLRSLIAAALSAAALLLAAPALAQDQGTLVSPANEARAKELFENGQILYDEGRYEDAITAWNESYRLTGYPDLLFNVANAYERAGMYREALDALNKYRAFATADERPTLDRRIAVMEQRAKEKEDEQARIAALQASSSPAPAPAPSSPPPQPTSPDRRGGVRPLPVALLSSGVVGLGVGGVFAAGASSAVRDIHAQCVDVGGGDYLCPSSAQGSADARGSKATISAITFGVGGALSLGGLLTAVIGGGSSADAEKTTLVPTVGADGAGLALDGRF